MEIVLFSYKMTHMAFPHIINKFQIKPFDFCKIIESVVRHEPEVHDKVSRSLTIDQLPRVVVKHLSGVEEKILESYAWEEGSPLYALLQDKLYVNGITSHLLSPTAPHRSHELQGLASPLIKTENAPKSHSLEVSRTGLRLLIHVVVFQESISPCFYS